MTDFKNVKATVTFSGYKVLHLQIEDGTTLVWESNVAPFMNKGEEVIITARNQGTHWDGCTMRTAVSHVKIKY